MAKQTRPYSAQFPNLGSDQREYNQLVTVTTTGRSSHLRTASFHGFTTKLNYTYGHSRDDDLSGTRGKLFRKTAITLRGDYGNSDFDVRHSFAGFISYNVWNAFTYETPAWRLAIKLASDLLHGPAIYGQEPAKIEAKLASIKIGLRLLAIRSRMYRRTTRRITHISSIRPLLRSRQLGTYANQPRNEFYGPGTQQVDFSVFKNTRITERLTTQLRFEMFNIFNTRDLAPPSTSLSSSSLGQVSSTLGTYNGAPGVGTGEPRNIQLALKLIF